MRGTRLGVLLVVAVTLGGIGVTGLIRTRAGLARSVTSVEGVPVEVITPAAASPRPWPGVLVVHGFAASRQLMYGIAQTLARNGYAAAVIDLPGHGQNSARMPMLTGRSSGFDAQLASVAAWLRRQPGVDGSRLALVGHSMGAGAVLRYAAHDPGIGATVAISGGLGPRGPIPPDVPRNVLAMAGAWEFSNVHNACRAAVTASYPAADVTQRQGSWSDGTARQCLIVPGVEHIGVLFSTAAATDVVRWLDGALGVYPPARPITRAMPIGPALWLHAAGALLFLALAELLFPRRQARAPARLSRTAVLAISVASTIVAAIVMRFVPGGWIPLLTADYLCGFFALVGLLVTAGLMRLGCPVVGALPTSSVAWRTVALVTVAVLAFVIVAQVSWLNVLLLGARRWLVVVVFPVWLVYFLASDALLRTRPPGEYLISSVAITVLTIAVLVAAVFTLRAPFFLLLLAPALVPVFLLTGLYGHWLRARTTSAWPTACVAASLVAWLMAAVFPLV